MGHPAHLLRPRHLVPSREPGHVAHWAFSGGFDIIKPHMLSGILVQSTIAILILVGFESCTALSAETKNAGKNIPKAIIISLVVQGVIAYLFEYFAASYMVSDKLINVTNKVTTTGLAAAAASSAPFGDLVQLLGNSIIPGIGFGLMITMAVTVAIAIIGTTLSAMNTAMRITAGIADSRELPSGLSFIHPNFRTPHMALVALVVAVSVIAIIGVQSVVGLTGIALASNLGTFILYGLTCVWTIVAFKGRKDFNTLKHAIIPSLGVVVNLLMTVAILYLYIIGNADAKAEAKICFIIAGGWAVVGLIYVAMTTVRKTYRFKMVSGMIRPEQLNIVVDALKEEDYILGMTVTKVKGFGRQKGHTNGEGETVPDEIVFVPKIRVDVVVREWDVQAVMDIIGEAARTGAVGDGKIFVTDASEAMRIRTGERGYRGPYITQFIHKEDAMKKIEAIIRPAKVGDVYAALGNAGCPGLTVSEIEGQGTQKGVEQEFRGKKYRTSLMTKAKIEIIANDEDVERLVDTICEAALTGKAGDGKIFVYPVEDVIRIRTKERGRVAA